MLVSWFSKCTLATWENLRGHWTSWWAHRTACTVFATFYKSKIIPKLKIYFKTYVSVFSFQNYEPVKLGHFLAQLPLPRALHDRIKKAFTAAVETEYLFSPQSDNQKQWWEDDINSQGKSERRYLVLLAAGVLASHNCSCCPLKTVTTSLRWDLQLLSSLPVSTDCWSLCCDKWDGRAIFFNGIFRPHLY